MKETLLKHIATIFLSLILVFSLIIPINSHFTYASTPSTAKALASIVQSYTPKDGEFKLTKESRFYIVSTTKPSSELCKTVKLLNSEFAAKKAPTSTPLDIVYGSESNSQKGDIVIKIVPDTYKSQQYKLIIDDTVKVLASDVDGIFYGLRTLLKYRITTGSNTLEGALIKDKPDIDERVIHLDCARKYFSPAWIKNFIKKSSWQGYNAIEIHFSEDQGMRLESKQYPWLAGSNNDSKGTYTQDQMAAICDVAKKYHMEVIPSFDSPGHMNYIVRRYKSYVDSHPDFKFTYKGKTYSKKNPGFGNISNYFKYNGDCSSRNYLGINLASSTAKAFTGSLIDEYAKFFKEQGCTKFNIGGDELLGWDTFYLGGRYFGQNDKWNALQHWDNYAKKTLKIEKGNAMDTFISYMNGTATRLEKMGYKCRMWSDEVYRKPQHVKLKRSIDIVYWSNNYTPLSKLEKKNFRFYNALSLWTYYVTKPCYSHVVGEKIYKSWKPKNFASPGHKYHDVDSDQYLGAYFCIWCDYATINTTKEVWSDLNRRTWSSSVKMWNTQVCTDKSGRGKALSYDSYKAYCDKIGTFPGYSGSSTRASKLPTASDIKKVSLLLSDNCSIY